MEPILRWSFAVQVREYINGPISDTHFFRFEGTEGDARHLAYSFNVDRTIVTVSQVTETTQEPLLIRPVPVEEKS